MDETMMSELPAAAQGLVEYWAAERGDSTLPTTSAIDPLRLRQWVGDVSIIDIHDGPRRFWVRLHGTNVTAYIGTGFERRYLEDRIPRDLHDVALEPYRTAISENLPVYSVIQPGLFTGVFDQFERLILPFARAGGGRAERFLVWVGQTNRDSFECETVYGTAAISGTDSNRCDTKLCVLRPAVVTSNDAETLV